MDAAAKREVVRRITAGELGAKAARGPILPGAFDMIWLPRRRFPDRVLSVGDIRNLPRGEFGKIRLIEVKSTSKATSRKLAGLFFSLQYAEQLAAQALGDSYQVVFVGIGPKVAQSFHRVFTLPEIWARARYIHVSFSLQF